MSAQDNSKPAMMERAAEGVAMKIRDLLVQEYVSLSKAGWADVDIRLIADSALYQCLSYANDKE